MIGEDQAILEASTSSTKPSQAVYESGSYQKSLAKLRLTKTNNSGSRRAYRVGQYGQTGQAELQKGSEAKRSEILHNEMDTIDGREKRENADE
jgi:hypothetical protein